MSRTFFVGTRPRTSTMTQRSLIALAVAGLLTLSAAFVSPERSVRVDDDDTKLALYMKDINKGLRGLRSSLREPERNAESITAVRELQIVITKSRSEDPARSAEMPEDARAAYVLDYQKMMLDFGMKVMELEAALLEGDNEAAQAVWKDVNSMKSPAHEKFKVKD
jgi:hypothetical protein